MLLLLASYNDLTHWAQDKTRQDKTRRDKTRRDETSPKAMYSIVPRQNLDTLIAAFLESFVAAFLIHGGITLDCT